MKKSKEAIEVVKNLRKNFKRLKGDKWNQGSLSWETRLAYHTIAKIESGATKDPRISTLKKIADAFNVSLDQLVK